MAHIAVPSSGGRRPARSPPPAYDVKIVAGRRVVIYRDKEKQASADGQFEQDRAMLDRANRKELQQKPK